MLFMIPSLNPSSMRIAKLLAAALLLVSSSFIFAAPPAQLTSEQQEQIDKPLENAEQLCLQGAVTQTLLRFPSKSDATTKMMASAGSDPGFCSCMKTGLRNGMTSELFSMAQEEASQYTRKLAGKIMDECLAPVIVQKFSESCEQIFGELESAKSSNPQSRTEMDSIGATSPADFAGKMCGCIRPALKNLAPAEFLHHAMETYKAYGERARTGDKTISAPPSVADAVFTGCTAQLQAQYKAGNKQAEINAPASEH